MNSVLEGPSAGSLDPDPDAVGLLLECREVPAELADADDAVEVRGGIVVVEDEVAAVCVVADVAGDGVVSFRRSCGGELGGQRRGLFGAVVVAEGEGHRK